MTVIEDKLKLEKRKTKVQSRVIGSMMADLRENQDTLQEKVRWLKDNGYNHEGWQKQLDEITRILDEAKRTYDEFKVELQDEKEKLNKIIDY